MQVEHVGMTGFTSVFTGYVLSLIKFVRNRESDKPRVLILRPYSLRGDSWIPVFFVGNIISLILGNWSKIFEKSSKILSYKINNLEAAIYAKV